MNSIFTWLFDADHWSGPTGVPARILEHLGYTGLTVLIAAAIAIPLGALVGHTGRGTFLVAGLSNGLRALPELGLLTLLVLLTWVGLFPVVVSLVVLAIPPILAGTYAGVRNVDRSVVDAARGMGMRESKVLTQVELPNALPLIVGGIRSAALQVIATATIAAYVALGGLGRLVIDGNNAGAGSPNGYPQMAAGAVLIALLALAVEGVLALAQRLVVSPGLRKAAGSPARDTKLASTRTSRRRSIAVATAVIVVVAGVVALTTRGGDPLDAQASGDGITVGSADFTESQLLAEIYAQQLENKGFVVNRDFKIGSREKYYESIEKNQIQLVPEYSGTLLQYLNEKATEVAPDEVYTALRKVLPDHLTVLDKAEAQDKDSVVVTKETAKKWDLKSIEDLAPHCDEITFGGPTEIQARPDGIPGLAETYGCNFKSFSALVPGAITTKALLDDAVQAADIFSTDASIEANDFVVLEDPKNNFAAQNVVPLINKESATPEVADALNAVSAKLDLRALQDLNTRLNAPDKPDIEDVAEEWLAEVDL